MPELLPRDDFRAARTVFTHAEIDGYYCDEKWLPINRVEPEVWEELTQFPVDVSYRTSERHGPLLKELVDLINIWIKLTPDGGPLFLAASDAIEEFKAGAFNCLHGYYRPAVGCLRLALENIVVGAYLELGADPEEVNAWCEGSLKTDQSSFGRSMNGLQGLPRVKELELSLRDSQGDSFLNQRSNHPEKPAYPGGWVIRLYGDLCHYSHAHPTYGPTAMTLVDGPMYTHQSLDQVVKLWLETSAVGCLLMKLARPGMDFPSFALSSPTMLTLDWRPLALAIIRKLGANPV
jgi:hypothetical protein